MEKEPMDFRTFATTYFPEKLTDGQIMFAESILKHETTGNKLQISEEANINMMVLGMMQNNYSRIEKQIDEHISYCLMKLAPIFRTATIFAAITGIYLLFQ